MLRVDHITKDWKEAGSFPAQINLYGFWDEHSFLTKSGDLGAALHIGGIDYESLDHAGRDYAVKRLEAAFRSLDDKCRLYQVLFKRNRPAIPHAEYENPLVRAAVEQRSAFLESKVDRLYSIEIYWVVVNRIVYGATSTLTVPTALMRQGNFTELLNTSLTGQAQPITLYQPGSAGTKPLSCNGVANVICPGQIDNVAGSLLNLYPQPNANGGNTYNNYTVNLNNADNTWQWGTRVDWNISSKDQIFARFSYWNEPAATPSPLGLPLDGGGENHSTLNENFVLSETHLFSPTLTNEFRFGYNRGAFIGTQLQSNVNISPSLGLGGVPYGPQIGGLPMVSVGGIAPFGSNTFQPAATHANDYQILDNVTKIAGNHSLKVGVDFQSIRFIVVAPPYARGTYNFGGFFTGSPGKSFTGSGMADFLLDQMTTAQLSNVNKFHDSRGYRSAYFEDNWTATKRLRLNLGVRYDYFQPVSELSGRQASFNLDGPISPGHGQGVLVYSKQQQNAYLAPAFLNYLQTNNIAIQYSGNPALANSQYTNFAPRLGFAYNIDSTTVVRGGFGIFYGGLESIGGPTYLENYPFQFNSNFPNGNSCKPGACATNGLTLETGFQQAIATGLANFVSQPTLNGVQSNIKTPYSENYNLTVQKSLSNNLTASLGYVGAVSRHLQVQMDYNSADALTDPRLNSILADPFPTIGSTAVDSYLGAATYNSLQTTLQKRYSNGLNFLATYTWSHAMDDAPVSSFHGNDVGYRNVNLIGIMNDYSNSPWDVRNRVTFNGYYQIPVGKGRRFLNHPGIADALVGGWSTDLQFMAQSGYPISVGTDLGKAGPNGSGSNAITIRDPFAPGGTPDPSNPGVVCATSTRNLQHWYNPCAFANPQLAFPNAQVAGSPISTTQITGLAALPYLGGRRLSISGPGYERINMSVFKDFRTFREQYLEFRTDIFNVLNTPAYGAPSVTDDSSSGGQITSARAFQPNTPDARFFQLSAKYVF